MPPPPLSPQKRIQGLAGDKTGANSQAFVLNNMPRIPDEVKVRFPSMQAYEDGMREWVKNLVFKSRQSAGQ